MRDEGNQSKINPYASPQTLVPAQSYSGSHDLYKLVKTFRGQIRLMAGYWIVLGVLALSIAIGLGILRPSSEDFDILGAIGVFAVVAVVCVTLGVCVAAKNMTAVYVAMILSYALMPVAPCINCWTIFILLANVGLAHRIIYTARKLTNHGIPLTARPQDIQVPVSLPDLKHL